MISTNNKMKSTSKRIIEVLKKIFTFSDDNIIYGIRIFNIILISAANYQAISAGDWQFMIVLNTLYISLFLLGYFSRKPDPNRKGFKKWLKICKLKVQIWHKQAYLFWYPDLKKYRGNPKRKAKVWAKRDRLKKLKRELSNILK